MLAAVLCAAAVVAPSARADGDPGSDVLVNQNLFAAADAGLSIAQQAQLGDLLKTAGADGLALRVAIIAQPSDLGTVTALWRRPRAYAGYLGIELSLAYTGRLLVVMPNGFGYNWPGHDLTPGYRLLAGIPVRSGAAGLVSTVQTAVHALAAGAGVTLRATAQTAAGGPASAPTTGTGNARGTAGAAAGAPVIVSGAGAGASGRSTDSRVGTLAVILVVLAGGLFAVRYAIVRRRSRPAAATPGSSGEWRARLRLRRVVPGVAVLFGIAAGAPIIVFGAIHSTTPGSQTLALERNPDVDPGTALSGAAPQISLSDQFGKPVSLSSFRGKVVMLAFTDSECTTICPMTTTAMLDAKAMLGPAAAAHVELLGVDANPASTSLEDVYSYSQLHGMLNQWHFLTGSLPQLRRVWSDYKVEADIERGLIAHTPALYVVSPQGNEAKVYITQQSYSAVGQFAQVLATEASSLLPGHPAVHSDLSYAPVPTITPAERVLVPRSGGGRELLGPDSSPRLYLFFATWDKEITSLAGHMDALDGYQSAAAGAHLPPLTAVDEGTVEPSQSALPAFLGSLPRPLSYPVAIDATGRIADGYEVLGEPWLVLVSATGRILWYWEVSTSGWPTGAALDRDLRTALARAPKAPTSAGAIAQDLAGAPAPLAALHAQAGRLVGTAAALDARVRALRGYPVVINAWASWCTPCRSEFSLLAGASAAYGRRVAFLGADTDDSPGDAEAFLAAHPVGYPSFNVNTSDLSPWSAYNSLPQTIYINRVGKVVFVHDGQYLTQGALDNDVTSYALGG